MPAACRDAPKRSSMRAQVAAGLALAGAVQGDRYIDHRHLCRIGQGPIDWPRVEALRRSMMAMLDLENPPEFAQPST
jgi:hypothetical protein